ncbi:MAG: HIT family protein [Patescibacteria group bacterium]|jgi:ATP adenylyltransferase
MISEGFDSDCTFCIQFNRGYKIVGKRKIKNFILYQTPNFVVFSALGPLIEGHLLITPKKHCYSIAGLPPDTYEELESLVKNVGQLLAKEYCKPIFFEHGTVSRLSRGGTSIDHCHLHAVPVNLDLAEILDKKFKKKEVVSLQELKNNFDEQKPYLFYESLTGQRFCYELQEKLESQYLRKVISESIVRKKYWNWREYPRTECFLKTLRKLSLIKLIWNF